MPDIEPELLAAARDVQANAHVPYSKFRAGAAVHTDAGDVVPGVIVENVSLGLAIRDSTVGELLPRGAVGLHVDAREHGIEAREGDAVESLPLGVGGVQVVPAKAAGEPELARTVQAPAHAGVDARQPEPARRMPALGHRLGVRRHELGTTVAALALATLKIR